MMRTIIYFLFFYFCFVSFSFAETIYRPSYVIPDGSFVGITESNVVSSGSWSIHMGYEKSLGNIVSVRILHVKDGVVTITPVYYSSGGRVFNEKVVMNGVGYNMYPEDSGETENEDEDNVIDDDDDDDDDDNVTIVESEGVYLNRIELYLLWILVVLCLSCGVQLFLSFKGFERL